ncbi:MAG: peptide ABC transporter substrate-binding protein [Actinobacteria bacterium]|nr:peptide ABC transporter substrate-binding protein [Actinomycetota bacterium]
MARALAAAIAVSLLAVSGAGGAGVQTPRKGGTVVAGPLQEPVCLNPLLAACEGTTFFWIVQKVLAQSFTVAPDFTQRPVLVSRVTFTKKPPFTFTYEIRPEARWSDGVPVGARDFVFTQAAIRKTLPPGSDNVHDAVRSVRVVDAKTVKVVLRSRPANWRSLFELVLPRHALVGEDLARVWTDRLDNPKTGRPIGSGPFLVEDWQRGKQLTLVRNPRYWGAHVAHLDRLVVRFCQACTAPPPAEVLEALRQGDVDFALSRDATIASDLLRIPGVRVLPTPSTGWEHISIRVGPGGHPALRNKLVRRALAYGIDRNALVRRLWGEIDPQYRPSHSAAFLPTSRHYRPNWSGYRYSPSESRRLLEQAGCRRGADGIYSCAGMRLSLRIITVAGVTWRERNVQLIQTQLRQAGIEALPIFANGPTIFGRILPSGDYDLASFAYFVAVDSIGAKDVFGCGGPQNYTGYCQRLVTRDLDQADRILDTDRRSGVLNRADRQVARDVPVIPLYQVPFVLAFRKTVRNVVGAPFSIFWNAEDWWLER